MSGGGGKGMRTVLDPADLAGAVRAARSEADSAFGDAAVYIERRLTRPRHIEVQVLGDEHGTVLPFVERECSIQRRHQKVVEETPSVAVTPELRQAMAAAAATVARAVGYTNAGTIEFLLGEDGRFFFLEMNTRLQVEHPITEMVTGIDLVQWQIRIARGERLDLDPEALLAPKGHAIECRIYAEDPDNKFLPSPGRILALRVPAGPGIRDDSGAAAGLDVPIFYDPMISKLVAWAEDRPARHRAHAPRARRVCRRGHQDDACRSSPGCSISRRSSTASSTPRFSTRSWRRGTGGRSSSRRRTLEEVAVMAAALQALLSPAGPLKRGTAPFGGRRVRWRRQAAWKDAGAARRPGEDCRDLRYEIEAGGRLRHVTVSRTGDSFAVSVDGRLHQVDAVRIDAHTLSLIVDSGVSAVPDIGRIRGRRVAPEACRPGGWSSWSARCRLRSR